MTHIMQWGWRIAIVAFVAVNASCALFGPERSEKYELIAVNGQPVPAVWYSGSYITGELVQIRIQNGTFSIYDGGQYAWDFQVERLIDGVADTAYGHVMREVGHYERRDSTLLVSWKGEVNWSQNGDTLVFRDITGLLSWGVFKFVRSQ